MASLIEAGADVVIRAGWKSARWLDGKGNVFDLVAELRKAATRGLIDRPIWIKRKRGKLLAVRLVAVRKPAQAAASRRKVHRDAQRGGHQLSKQTLDAADWVILVTSLKPRDFATADVLALYRLRWRIELAFKRLKSLIGVMGPRRRRDNGRSSLQLLQRGARLARIRCRVRRCMLRRRAVSETLRLHIS